MDVSQLKLSDAERKIYDCLGKEPKHVEQVIAETNLAAGVVNAITNRIPLAIEDTPIRGEVVGIYGSNGDQGDFAATAPPTAARRR